MRKVIHSNFELDLSNKKITDISENPIFSDKFSAKYSYPIEIDLDDGVKVNYAKFQDIEVPQGEGKKPKKANLLSKI